MGIIPNFLKSRKKRSTLRNVWGLIAKTNTSAGVPVDEVSSLKYLTVYACVSLIAGDIARLPLIIYQKMEDGSKRKALNHPLYDLLHNTPNEEISSFNWRETVQAQLLLWGNSYNLVQRNPFSGEVLSISPIENPGGMVVKRTNKGIIYEWYEDGEKIVKQRKDILHLAGFGFNGLMGISNISLAKEAIGLGLAAESFGSTYFSNGNHPSGIVTLPMEAQPMEEAEEEEYLKALKKQYSGLGKHHQMMVFQNGEKYQQVTIPLNDCQFLESRNFQKDEICGMFHVPPHKIAKHGQNSNYNNLEQENQGYLDSCLTHWTTRWEQTLSQQLLRKDERQQGFYIEFLIAGFLKGDMKARAEFYRTLFNMGYPLNRILNKENENPVDGGNQGFIPLNMIHMDKADEVLNVGSKKETKALPLPKIETRSIIARDRISGQYYPLIERAIEDVIAIEIAGISNKINSVSLEDEIKSFYDEFPKIVINRISPVLSSLGIAIRDSAAEDMGVEPESIDIDKFISDYIDGYGNRHSKDSRNQLLKLIRDGDERSIETRNEQVIERLKEWRTLRPEKVVDNEIVRVTCAVFQHSVHYVGHSIVWRTRGKSCPFCNSLSGKRVSTGGLFLGKGESIDIDGLKPFKSKGIKRHPPLHKGCDCYLEIF